MANAGRAGGLGSLVGAVALFGPVLISAPAGAVPPSSSPAPSAPGHWWLGDTTVPTPPIMPPAGPQPGVTLSPGATPPSWWPVGPVTPNAGTGAPITPDRPTASIAPLTPPAAPVTPGASTAYAQMAFWVMPHEDDEGSLWADQLNNDDSSFPVFIYLTNGDNTGYCTNDTPIEYAPTGTLGSADQPPFNWAGDLSGAPGGYAGAGPPPEYDGAQGDDPPVYPADPNMNRSTGWQPLLQAGSYTGPDAQGTSWTEGFDGPCRASRLAATTMMMAQENAALSSLSDKAAHSRFPDVAAGEAPDGQVCFSAPMNEAYQTGAGTYAYPAGGAWASAAVPPGVQSGKDPCAYYWLTPTGDVFVFNLGDQSQGYKTACPADLGRRLTDGGTWPDETIGYASIGAYPAGARPGDGTGCANALPTGAEAYAASPSDSDWMIQQVFGSGLLPPGLPLVAVNGSGYLDGYNRAQPTGGSIDVNANQGATACYYLTGGGSSCGSTAPAGACEHYLHPDHLSVGLDMSENRPVPVIDQFAALCSGDPPAAYTFGTRDPADGAAFWTAIYNNDGSGAGWEGGYRAYAWDGGFSLFDPYGNVPTTCPGSAPISSLGQQQFACQEAVAAVVSAPGPGSRRGQGSQPGGGPPPGAASTPPGDGIRGMQNVVSDPRTGEGFTYPL